jgi:putative motility protein YjfB-like
VSSVGAATTIQAREGRCRFSDVSISPESVSAAYQARVDNDRQIAVMKKAGEVQKDTAQALVDLVKQAPMPEHVGTRLNVLA